MFEPWKHMLVRLESACQEGQAEYFNDLLNAGELLTKLSVAISTACLRDDPSRLAHSLSCQLIRADSLGKWADVGRDLWKAPFAPLLPEPIAEALETMHLATSDDSQWHRRALITLDEALRLLKPETDVLPRRSSFPHWLLKFSELRNATRGHGAQPLDARKNAAMLLATSVTEVATHCPALQLPLFHVTHDLSGTSRVRPLTSLHTEAPKGMDVSSVPNGRIVVLAHDVFEVGLLFAASDCSDYFLPNGTFRERRDQADFEVLSYATGDSARRDGSDYRTDPGGLPVSTTSAGELDARGVLFTNAPSVGSGYVKRDSLESELAAIVDNHERYPVVTLLGRGGIGKTSLALAEIDRLSKGGAYFAVIWFSARDIDLMEHGPKPVKADVLTLEDVARSYKRVIGDTSKRAARELFSEGLSSADIGSTLFVFDNFETIRAPEEFFRFVDERVRLPNKVLITTRHRFFRGDFPIEVKGMTESECNELIQAQANQLGIGDLVTAELRREIAKESEGHPYVMKIMLGEIAHDPKAKKVSRVIASRDDILDALFDRTYRRLSPAARRVFLTLCSWRSVVPLIALEAVLLREANERIRVDDALEELERLSFVEVHESGVDRALFVGVPLAAAIFWSGKAASQRGASGGRRRCKHSEGFWCRTDIGCEARVGAANATNVSVARS